MCRWKPHTSLRSGVKGCREEVQGEEEALPQEWRTVRASTSRQNTPAQEEKRRRERLERRRRVEWRNSEASETLHYFRFLRI